MKRRLRRVTTWGCIVVSCMLVTCHAVLATERPSLFRGVAVADSPLGVRVVSVQESSQAACADLRPEDIVVRVREAEIRSIDEFAAVSAALRGRATSVTLLVFRNGAPHELTIHLYSDPIWRAWSIEFIPDDVRFAEPQVGFEYWMRLGRGFESVGNTADALHAYLNGLHNVPAALAVALKVSQLFSEVSRRQLTGGALADGIGSLRQAVTITERLFDRPLTTEQLQSVRDDLQATARVLHETAAQRAHVAP